MASFTDAISQFNPYVSQLPIQAMKEVGMYKQAKYEEGVQKIQGEIDKVAGLDITKPLHKQYLESKLNQLGSKLKTVAAGDFSNFQLVNSVGGMATQIGKDKVIQNAVRSTQQARQEQEKIQIAQKAGKSSVNNEDYYYDDYSKWLNDGKLDTTFTGEFVEYKDVDAKLRDLTSKLKEDETSVENPFERDGNGKTLYYYTDPKTKKEMSSTDPSKGQPRWALDMLKVSVKGLPAQRILNNFYNSLDANDQRQLRIDSWAHYRGAGPEKFTASIKEAYANKKEMLSEELVDLAVNLKNPQITGVDKQKIEARMAEVNDIINNKVIEKEMSDDLLELQNPKNLEDFKYKTYTQNHLTGLAKDLANRSYIEERKANPAEQANLARQKFQFDQIQENNKLMMFRTTEGRLEREFEYKKDKDYLEKVSKGYRVTPGEWKTGERAPEVNDLQNDLAISAKQYVETQNKFAERLYPSGTGRYKNMTLDQKRKALDTMTSNYRKNPNMELTPDEQEYLEQNRQVENGLSKTINQLNSAQQFEIDFKKKYVDDKLQNQTISAGGTTYSGGDVVDFNSNIDKFNKSGISMGRSGTPVASQYFDDKEALKFYTTYKGGKLLPIYNAWSKDRTPFAMMSKDDENLVNFSKNVKASVGDVDAVAKDAVGKHIATISPKYTVQRAAIDMSDPNKVKDLDEFLATKQGQFNAKGALDVSFGEYTPTGSAEIRAAKGSSFLIEKNKDGSANVVLMGANGSKQIVPAQPSEVALFFREVAVTSPFADLKETILSSKTKTTNSANVRFEPGSGSGAINAMLSGYQLGQLNGSGYESKVRVDVEGNLSNTGNPETDSYTVVMYVPDMKTGGWKGNYVSGGYVSESDVISVLSKISPDNINQAIKRFK